VDEIIKIKFLSNRIFFGSKYCWLYGINYKCIIFVHKCFNFPSKPQPDDKVFS
jgi:hypothetical protein